MVATHCHVCSTETKVMTCIRMSLDFWVISSVYCHCRHLVKKKESKTGLCRNLILRCCLGEKKSRKILSLQTKSYHYMWGLGPACQILRQFFPLTFELTVHVIHPITFGQELIYFVRLLNRWSMGDKKATGFLES